MGNNHTSSDWFPRDATHVVVLGVTHLSRMLPFVLPLSVNRTLPLVYSICSGARSSSVNQPAASINQRRAQSA